LFSCARASVLLAAQAPRLIEMLREVRKLGGGAAAEHAAALVSDGDLGEGGDDELQDELYEAEDLLDKARARREDAMRAMRADVEALGLQVSKVDAKLSVGTGDDVSRLHALRDSIKGEIQECASAVFPCAMGAKFTSVLLPAWQARDCHHGQGTARGEPGIAQ
jgi:hypothetical protein